MHDATTPRRSTALGNLLDDALSKRRPKQAAPDDAWFDSVVMLLVDAVATTDANALHSAEERLRVARRLRGSVPDEVVGSLRTLHLVARWGAERSAANRYVALEPSSHAATFLRVVAETPGLSNSEICARLGIDETEATRTGAKLRTAGLAVARRFGRRNAWEATPRGLSVLEELGNPAVTVQEVSASPEAVESVDRAGVEAAVKTSAEAWLRLVHRGGKPAGEKATRRRRSTRKDPEVAAFELLFRPLGKDLADRVGQVRGVVETTAGASLPRLVPPGEIVVKLNATPPRERPRRRGADTRQAEPKR